MEYNIIYNLP